MATAKKKKTDEADKKSGGGRVAKPREDQPITTGPDPRTGDEKARDDAAKSGFFDPKFFNVDTTNPNALPIIQMLSAMFMQRAAQGPQKSQNYAGPMGQLYGNLPRFNPSNINAGYKAPGAVVVDPRDVGDPRTTPGTDPKDRNPSTENGGLPYNPDPDNPFGTFKPGDKINYDPRNPNNPFGPRANFSPAAFIPVNSGSSMIRSFTPSYENQYTSFDPEVFLRSL